MVLFFSVVVWVVVFRVMILLSSVVMLCWLWNRWWMGVVMDGVDSLVVVIW